MVSVCTPGSTRRDSGGRTAAGVQDISTCEKSLSEGSVHSRVTWESPPVAVRLPTGPVGAASAVTRMGVLAGEWFPAISKLTAVNTYSTPSVSPATAAVSTPLFMRCGPGTGASSGDHDKRICEKSASVEAGSSQVITTPPFAAGVADRVTADGGVVFAPPPPIVGAAAPQAIVVSNRPKMARIPTGAA